MPPWLDRSRGWSSPSSPLMFIVLCLLIEERVLRTELPEYADHTRKVRWRLVPFVW